MFGGPDRLQTRPTTAGRRLPSDFCPKAWLYSCSQSHSSTRANRTNHTTHGTSQLSLFTHMSWRPAHRLRPWHGGRKNLRLLSALGRRRDLQITDPSSAHRTQHRHGEESALLGFGHQIAANPPAFTHRNQQLASPPVKERAARHARSPLSWRAVSSHSGPKVAEPRPTRSHPPATAVRSRRAREARAPSAVRPSALVARDGSVRPLVDRRLPARRGGHGPGREGRPGPPHVAARGLPLPPIFNPSGSFSRLAVACVTVTEQHHITGLPLRSAPSPRAERQTNSFPGTLEASALRAAAINQSTRLREMSISMRLAIPAPAAAIVAPPRLRVRAAGNGGSLPAASVALRTETAALR
jgi:hypothetical protein